MKILLVSYDNDNSIAYFPLGLGYLAAAIRNSGHDVEIYQQDIYHYPIEHLTEYLDNNHFDIIGLGACGGYYQYDVIKNNVKAINNSKDRPILILGGHLPSPEPEYFLRKFQADFIVIGEGEGTTVELINGLEKGKKDFNDIKSIAYIDENAFYIETERREPIKNIDEIAWPAYDLFDMEQYVLYPAPKMKRKDRNMVMLSGRGCPFKCNFCYRLDKGFRPRSTKGLIDEILFLKKQYMVTFISFWDELLMSSISRMYEFCNGLIDENVDIHWSCNGRLNFASKDLEMLKLMKKAGCVFINYGIESMDNNCLKLMHKNLTTEMIIKGIENTELAGISPGLNIIFGNLKENRAVIEKDVEFLLKYDDHAQLRTIRPVTPYPGTDLYNLAIEKGLIKDIEDFYENKHRNSDLLTCNLTDMTDDEFYECLFWANSMLLNNYINNIKERNSEILENLYHKKDSNFRGFRMV
ncbi:radical SAM protein [Acetobacterium paludosum]|uniref:Radical SAM protein n=1 Tax=Acetobacterium paludosum TaxID=52693 RepID=A0A923KSD2_9FIRM|nr:radical SAM protein [Acetobacterium paludosum]MBC3888247.1 radical SAM protein [Acetobacterium paludosum]